MPEPVYEHLMFSGLDEAVERMKAFAKAHNDFEPSLDCERDKSGRRRWALTVVRTTAKERRHLREPET